MRAQSSVTVQSVVVVLAMVSGCSPDEPTVVAVAPEAPVPEPELEPGARFDPFNHVREASVALELEPQAVQRELNDIRERRGTPGQVQVQRESRQSSSTELPQTPLRLVFECDDGVTFAVRMFGNALMLYPPGYPPNGSLTLPQVTSATGVHYRVGDIDFRSNGDVATLEMGRERYVDCVANPAAAAWQETPPRITTPR